MGFKNLIDFKPKSPNYTSRARSGAVLYVWYTYLFLFLGQDRGGGEGEGYSGVRESENGRRKGLEEEMLSLVIFR